MDQHIRILMVEDNPRDAELIERELRRGGLRFSLQRVDNEPALREALESTDPDIILGDYNLPGFDGIEALAIACSLVPDTPFIFVSGSIGEELAVQTLRDGATDYILKDRLSRLTSAITRALEQRRDRQLRRRAQEALQRVSHQQELILNSAAEGIISIDRSGRALVVNPAAAMITGFSVEELLACRNIHERIHHSHPDGSPYASLDCPVIQTIGDGKPRIAEEVFWRKSGQSFPVEFNCAPIREGNEITGGVVIFEDITERQRLEQKIQQAQRVASLGRVAATIAHEFNNVLMGVQPFAEVIRRSSQEEKSVRAAGQILNSVARGARITQEILRFTQPAEPSLQVADLQQWAERLVPELQALVGDRIRVELQTPGEPVTVRIDPVQLQQVVTNLVINARDAIPETGTIWIRIVPPERGSEMARLSVRDSGTGISPDVLANMFEPLFTTKKSGTGLGLAVAQQVVSRHGGSIHAESTPGKGAMFSILLPAQTRAAEPEELPGAARTDLRSLLLVDDDIMVADGLTSLLENHGIRVHTVHLGAKVMEAITSLRPDAVILDLNLPDMNGAGLYEAIASRWPNLPVVFSTGDLGAAVPHRHTNAGVLRKPYDLDALLTALDQVRDRARLTAAGGSE